MADLGFLAALAGGVEKGFSSYRTERDYQDKKREGEDEKAMKRRMYQMQLMDKGIEDDGSGGFRKTEASKRRDAMGEAKEQAGLLKSGHKAVYDPTTGTASLERIPGFKDLDEEEKRLSIALKQKELNAKGAGKVLPASDATALGGANAAISSVDDAVSFADENQDIMGPQSGIMGTFESVKRFGGMDSSADRYDVFDANMDQRAQVVGKYLEGGKLAEGDVPRYRKMLPTRGDTPAVVRGKAESLKRLIAQRQAEEKRALGGAGYDVNSVATTPTPSLSTGLLAGKPSQGGMISDAHASGGEMPALQDAARAELERRKKSKGR